MRPKILVIALFLVIASLALPAQTSLFNAASNYWLFFGNAANPYAFQVDFWPWEMPFPFGGGSFFANGPDPFSAEWGPLDAEWFWPQWRLYCLAVGDPLLVPPGPAWMPPYGYGWGYPYWHLAISLRPVPPPQIVRPVSPKRYHKPPSIAKQRGGRYSPGRPPEGGFPSQGGGFSPSYTPREASFPPPMRPPSSRGGGMSHKR